MSDVLVYGSRHHTKLIDASLLEKINIAISPDNININNSIYHACGNNVIVIMNPMQECSEIKNPYYHDSFLAMSAVDDEYGSYAKFFVSEEKIEICSDVVGSKTIWYYFDDKNFFASTSQRAIIWILNSFQLNPFAVDIFIQTGCLGFGYSWDKRIKQCNINENVVLSSSDWTLKRTKIPTDGFSAAHIGKSKYKTLLKEAIDASFVDFDKSLEKAILPLSGGYDSRYIMLKLIDNGLKPRTITWGHPGSINDPHNDASVASRLAHHFGLQHEYVSTYVPDESLRMRLDRFLRLGECRVENVNAYLDGFALWGKLNRDGLKSVIRGDEVFGWSHVVTNRDVRNANKLLLTVDYENGTLSDNPYFKLEHDFTPYAKKRNEGIEDWRDRLYQEYMCPFFYSPLNYMKSKYIQVYTPYYSERIVRAIRKIPGALRTGKRLFKEIVEDRFDRVPIATHPANIQFDDFFNSSEFNELMKSSLDNKLAYFSSEYFAKISRSIDSQDKQKVRVKSIDIKKIVPRWAKDFLLRNNIYSQKFYLDSKQVAFRLYLIQNVIDLFERDAHHEYSILQ